MKLRYTGPSATTFSGIGEVLVGAVFEVPDEDAEAYTGRGDIEIVPEAKVTGKTDSKPSTEAEAAPAAE